MTLTEVSACAIEINQSTKEIISNSHDFKMQKCLWFKGIGHTKKKILS